MRSIVVVLGSIALVACSSYERRAPAQSPGRATPGVSQTETTSAKVPAAGTSPYGPADYGFETNPDSEGRPLSSSNPRHKDQGPGNILTDSNSD